MKQTITPEQLNELSDKGKDKLRKWCLDKGYITRSEAQGARELFKDGMSVLNLLSIGQMIEFLDEQGQHNITSGERDGRRIWVIDVLWTHEKEFIKEELADALWQACKEVLNK